MELNIGVIGFGWMANYHYQNIIPKDEGIHMIAAYDNDPARLEFAGELGLSTYDNLEDFLSRKDFETVLIATPNNAHKDLCIAALKAGKHVICEKPVTLNTGELEEIIAVSREYGRIFTIHQNRRRDKDFCIVKKAVEDGLLGTPFFIESRVQGANGIPSDWRRVKAAGGGMLLDWGAHLIDQILHMTDSPVVQVYALLKNVNYAVDDNCKLLLQFANGLSAHIEVCTTCFQPLPRWHVLGSEGTLDIRNFECEGSIIRGTVKEVDWSLAAIKHAAGSTRTMRPRPEDTVETLPLPAVDVSWGDYYRNFQAALQGKEPLFVTPEEAVRNMKVIDLCFESAQAGTSLSCHI